MISNKGVENQVGSTRRQSLTEQQFQDMSPPRRHTGSRASQQDGVVLQSRRRKERKYPELLSKLVVLTVEVGGRSFEETRKFLCLLARAKVRCENTLLRKRIQQPWRLQWGALLSCTTACAVASSMLELPGARGADGDTGLVE